MGQANSILLEIDAAALNRLLAQHAISVEEFRGADVESQKQLRKLFLEQLGKELKNCGRKKPSLKSSGF